MDDPDPELPAGIIFRDYTPQDYTACEALVGQAWDFSRAFQPPALSGWALRLYTLGSLLGSDYRSVIEADDQVAGFLFGRNERQRLPESTLHRLRTSAGFLVRLFLLKGVSLPRKFSLLRLLNQHEANRSRVERRGASEINLFVIDRRLRRHGLGRRMIEGFSEHCAANGVQRIIVEVNIDQAGGFYHKCGFTEIGRFQAPLHALAAGPDAALFSKACHLRSPSLQPRQAGNSNSQTAKS